MPPTLTAPPIKWKQSKEAKKALLIGIAYLNHRKKKYHLKSSHNDVQLLKKLLIEKYGYEEGDITILADDGKHTPPTKANILLEMKKLVADTKKGHRRVFHYSGHGSQVPREKDDGTEPDGFDEAIIPCDAKFKDKYSSEWILDDVLHDILVKNLPPKCQLTAIFDMCHSGTALDLPHYECNSHKKGVCDCLAHSHVMSPVQVDGVSTLSRKSSLNTMFENNWSNTRGDDVTKSPTLLSGTTTPRIAAPLARHKSHPLFLPRNKGVNRQSSITAVLLPPPVIMETTREQEEGQKPTEVAPPVQAPAPRLLKRVLSKVSNMFLCHPDSLHFRRLPSTRRGKKLTIQVPQVQERKEPVEPDLFGFGTEDRRMVMSPKGVCPHEGAENHIQPEVISLSACSDAQVAYETPQGESLTKMIVNILEKDPFPTYNDLMNRLKTRMGELHILRKQAIKLRTKLSSIPENLPQPGSNPVSPVGDSQPAQTQSRNQSMDSDQSVQSPQLGSTSKLNLDDRLRL